MTKIVATGLIFLSTLTGAAVIAPAAASAAPVPTCSSDTNVRDNEMTIIQQLRNSGYDVQSVDEWAGCVRAVVADANGQYKAYFDPDTLQLLATNEAPRG